MSQFDGIVIGGSAHLLCCSPLDQIISSKFGLRKATFYKANRFLRQFQYEHRTPGGKGRKPFTLVDTNPTSTRNMLLGLEMADQVDQSFVKVHFHRMTIEYSN